MFNILKYRTNEHPGKGLLGRRDEGAKYGTIPGIRDIWSPCRLLYILYMAQD